MHKTLEQKKSEKLKSVLIKDKVWNTNNFIFKNQYEDYLNNGVCSVQGYYPATEFDKESESIDKKTIGTVALSEREIGQDIPNFDYIKFHEKGNGELPFGNFSVSNKGLFRLIQSEKTLEPSFSFIGHLPKFKDKSEQAKKQYYKNYCISCNENKPDGCEIQLKFDTKSFHCLGQESLRENQNQEMIGKSFLGVLKADVDNLGLIFRNGLSKNENRDKDYFSISRYSGLSKNINYFFTEYLSEILKEKFPDIYTVYAGGDDLFLLGLFPSILKFIKFYQTEFQTYTCENPNISFSAGFALQKPRAPISIGASRAEEELENAKQNKNSISLFGNSLSWNEFSKCLEITENLKKYIDSEILTTGQMYRLLKYIKMYKAIDQNPLNVMYNSYFVYDKHRNIYAKISEKGNSEKDLQYKNLAKDLEEYFSKDFEKRKILDFLEVPIQLAIYQSRGGKG